MNLDAIIPIKESELHIAALKDDEKTITNLVKEKKLPVNLQNEHGDTALHIAVRAEKIKAIQTLIDLGANPNELNNISISPYNYVKSENSNTTREIIQYMKTSRFFISCDTFSGKLWRCIGTKVNKSEGFILQYQAYPNIYQYIMNEEISPASETTNYELRKYCILDYDKSRENIKALVENKLDVLYPKIIESIKEKRNTFYFECRDVHNIDRFNIIKDCINGDMKMRHLVEMIDTDFQSENESELKQMIKVRLFEKIDSYQPKYDDRYNILKKMFFCYYIDEKGDYIVQLPNREAFIVNYRELRKADPSLPDIKLAPSKKIASDVEFVQAFLDCGIVASDGAETFHDMMIHVFVQLDTCISGSRRASFETEMNNLKKSVKPIHDYLKNLSDPQLDRQKKICQMILGIFVDTYTSGKIDFGMASFNYCQIKLIYELAKDAIGKDSGFKKMIQRRFSITTYDEIWDAWKKLVIYKLNDIDPSILELDFTKTILDIKCYKSFTQEFLDMDWLDQRKNIKVSEVLLKKFEQFFYHAKSDISSKIGNQILLLRQFVTPINDYLNKIAGNFDNYKINIGKFILSQFIFSELDYLTHLLKSTSDDSFPRLDTIESYEKKLKTSIGYIEHGNTQPKAAFKLNFPNNDPYRAGSIWKELLQQYPRQMYTDRDS